jgi:hypothetical protein
MRRIRWRADAAFGNDPAADDGAALGDGAVARQGMGALLEIEVLAPKAPRGPVKTALLL